MTAPAPQVFVCPDCQTRWQRQPLTARQREILTYIEDSIVQRGIAPSLAEIAARFGFQSLATVHEHLRNLEHKGWITRAYDLARAITLVEAPR